MASPAADNPLPDPLAEVRAGWVREIVLRELKDAPVGTWVLLSGGVDSQLVLRALHQLSKCPVAASFRLEGHESTDWRIARRTAEEYGVPFRTIELSSDLGELNAYVKVAVEEWGLDGKAAIECFWPRLISWYAAVAGGAPAIATGDGGDGYHGLSKRAMIHYRDTVEDMDAFRDWYFGRPDYSQTATIRKLAGVTGVPALMPLGHPDLLERVFRGLTWGEVNRPRQKELLRRAFDVPDGIPKHLNLQLADSGIADLFVKLADHLGYSSPVKLYNSLRRYAASNQEGLF